MFRHRKRLISKRLSRLMHQKTKKSMKALFLNFIQSRAQQVQSINPEERQTQGTEEMIEEEEESFEKEEVDFGEEDDGFDEEDDGPAEMSIANYVASLSPHEKKIFKQENPELPETFFMTKKEKERYFAQKAQKFQASLKSTPERKSKTSKHVQFKEKFAFKPFNKFQKVTEVKKTRQSQSPYNTKIHFS